jgi:hypothetical protein
MNKLLFFLIGCFSEAAVEVLAKSLIVVLKWQRWRVSHLLYVIEHTTERTCGTTVERRGLSSATQNLTSKSMLPHITYLAPCSNNQRRNEKKAWTVPYI